MIPKLMLKIIPNIIQKMIAKMIPTIIQKLPKGRLKVTEKVPKQVHPDPQKRSYPLRGVTKTAKSRSLPKVTKMSPKCLRKSSQNPSKSVPGATKKITSKNMFCLMTQTKPKK